MRLPFSFVAFAAASRSLELTVTRAAIFASPVLFAVACGGSHAATGSVDPVPDDGGGSLIDGPIYLDASCTVAIDEPALLPAVHVAVGSAVTWDSNPPSSGPHYPIWAAFQTYTSPVPRGYYVHDLEHGAVVLLYNCGDAGCPDIVAGLQAVSDALPDDPLCQQQMTGVRVRTVITPDPLLDVPVAAAAWGWTYKADCLDMASLQAFATEHYGQGPELLCADGTTQF